MLAFIFFLKEATTGTFFMSYLLTFLTQDNISVSSTSTLIDAQILTLVAHQTHYLIPNDLKCFLITLYKRGLCLAFTVKGEGAFSSSFADPVF